MENATTPEVSTFDVLNFVENVEYPTDTVTLYTDMASAKKFAQAKADRNGLGAQTRAAKELDATIAELSEKLESSAITFELRGFAPGIVQEILDMYDESDKTENPEEESSTEPLEGDADSELIARAIISVKNAKGEIDPRTWKGEDVNRLKRNIAEGEFGKLLAGVAGVIFNAAVFDQAVDAGFSG